MIKQRTLPFSCLATALLLVLGLVLAACGGASQPTSTKSVATQPATIDAANLLATRCSTCHSADVVKQERASQAQWERVVTDMMQRGTQLSDAEKQALVSYLAANYHQ